jgi:hypothetical protein
MDVCPICTRIFILEEKLKNSSKLKQLEEIKVKHLEETDLKYSKWKKDTKLVEEQMDRTMKEEKSAEISEIEDECEVEKFWRKNLLNMEQNIISNGKEVMKQ